MIKITWVGDTFLIGKDKQDYLYGYIGDKTRIFTLHKMRKEYCLSLYLDEDVFDFFPTLEEAKAAAPAMLTTWLAKAGLTEIGHNPPKK